MYKLYYVRERERENLQQFYCTCLLIHFIFIYPSNNQFLCYLINIFIHFSDTTDTLSLCERLTVMGDVKKITY